MSATARACQAPSLPSSGYGSATRPQPTDRIFPNDQHVLFNNILEEEALKFDREGQRRTAYSLRHTYICLRLMEGADIYQIAKNCRTSVEMIEKYYAWHIKNQLSAAAINVKRLPKNMESKSPLEAGTPPISTGAIPKRRPRSKNYQQRKSPGASEPANT